jgi:hypothetical protein
MSRRLLDDQIVLVLVARHGNENVRRVVVGVAITGTRDTPKRFEGQKSGVRSFFRAEHDVEKNELTLIVGSPTADGAGISSVLGACPRMN